MVSARSLAFGATMFSSSALNNLFVTYYITYFTSVVGITPRGFYFAQAVFMCWNAVNDVVFGWLSDHCCTRRTRRPDSIRWGGWVWVSAFVLMWLPIPPSPAPGVDWSIEELSASLYFLLVLCVYDGGLTFVEVNHSALLAEITSSPSERADCNMWSAVCAGMGSLSSWLAYVTWDPTDLSSFRWVTLAVGAVAVCVFEVSSRYMASCILASACVESADVPPDAAPEILSPTAEERSLRRQAQGRDGDVSPGKAVREDKAVREEDEGIVETLPPQHLTWWAFFYQLLHQRNFVVTVLLSTLQVFDCTFEKNFFSLSLDFLVGNHVSPSTRGIVISSSFVLPHLCTIFVTPIIRSKGLHTALSVIFCCRMTILSAAMILGGSSPAVVCTIVSDLTDEDTWVNRRPAPLSASVAGSAAFFPKFSQSLAPMLGLALLPTAFSGPSAVEPASQALLWRVLIAVPAVCVCVQFSLWTGAYTLKGVYLKKVKLYSHNVTRGRDAAEA